MKTLRIAQTALATILAVGINSTTFAFMAVPAQQAPQVQNSLTDIVESFRDEIEAGDTKCEDMLAKLDAALEDIDAKLDAGVENEADYLAARDEIAKMRYDLECLAQKLTQIVDPAAPGLGGGDLGGGFGGDGFVIDGPLSSSGPFTTGGSTGSGLGALAPLGIAAGVGIPAATDNDNRFPGLPSSQSVAN